MINMIETFFSYDYELDYVIKLKNIFFMLKRYTNNATILLTSLSRCKNVYSEFNKRKTMKINIVSAFPSTKYNLGAPTALPFQILKHALEDMEIELVNSIALPIHDADYFLLSKCIN